MGKLADALALILACTTANDASVNYRMYVLQRPCKVPITPMGKRSYMLASTLACTTAADALVNYRGYVPQRLSVNSPLPRWDFHMFALACACRAAVSLFRVAR